MKSSLPFFRRLVIRVVFAITHYAGMLACTRRRIAASLGCYVNGGQISGVWRVWLDVPLRCNGSGIVRISGNVRVGFARGVRVGDGSALIQARSQSATVVIGDSTAISNNFVAIANVGISIGERCIIGESVTIYDSDFHAVSPEQRASGDRGRSLAVSIADDVWIGSRAMVLKGVSIGAGAVVAPGAVVTRDVPRQTLVGGVPARTIRKILSAL